MHAPVSKRLSKMLMRTPWHVRFAWLTVVVWMGVIFDASTDMFSADHTSRFIEPFLRWISRGSLSEEHVQELHFLIRKLAHLTEYALLAMLTWNAIWRTTHPDRAAAPRSGDKTVFGLSFLVATIYAAGDEFHQRFVPSRGASVHDVMIDAAGAIIGLAILQGCRVVRRRWVGRYPHPDRS